MFYISTEAKGKRFKWDYIFLPLFAVVAAGQWTPGMNYPITALFRSHRGYKCSCQSGLRLASSPVGSAPGLRIWILRVGRSTPTLVPASPCNPHTQSWAFHGGDLSSLSPLDSVSSSSSESLVSSFLPMGVRGVVCLQQRNS